MVKNRCIHHLAKTTKHLDKTVCCWRDLPGLKLVAGSDKLGYRHYLFEISSENFVTVLRKGTEDAKPHEKPLWIDLWI
ncbi:MAG: hypothetical protein KBH99_10195 [Syntrophobacteraceae bacterium]|nr:hypothetical protein [Syntrophobacteraceae bacterium]